MNSDSASARGRVVSVGDNSYLYSRPYPGDFDALVEASSAKHEFQIAGIEFSLLKIEQSAAKAIVAFSFSEYLETVDVLDRGPSTLLFEIFATENGKSIVDGDQRAIATLFDIAGAFKLAGGSAALHRVRGFEEAVLVHPRAISLPAEAVIVCNNAAQSRSAKVLQNGRFLVHNRQKLRLAALELTADFEGNSAVMVTPNGVFPLALTYIDYASIDDFHARNTKNDPDILQMFYQTCRPARHRLSTLITQDSPRAILSEPDWSLYFKLDGIHQLSNGYFISGWFTDPEERILDAIILDFRLDDPDILEQWTVSEEVLEREGKRALAKRFRAFVPGKLRGEPFLPRLKLTLRGGLSVILASPQTLHDTAKLRDAILSTIEDRTFSEDLFVSAYAPALAPLQQKLNERQDIRTSLSYGKRSRREVSLVIPLFAQLGFIRSQLMAFLQDPFVREACQIIYALDDPRLVREARTLLDGYEAWAPLDIQLLVLDRNGGYALANNTATAESDGEHLVLLNSDVIPAEIGWIEAALETLGGAPNYSVVGPKLLYADDSLQHAGMYFQKFPHGYWQNLHYWKGYGRDYAPATESRPVPGVTGACMILRTSEFLEVGGFTSDYVLGDYEDSDLCMKLLERGGQCLYLASSSLYHFERQSMPRIEDGHDRRSTIYNRALHTSRWDKQLTSLMAEFS